VKTRALFLASGDEGAGLKDDLAQLSSALRRSKAKGLRWGSATYPEENHGSVVLRSHYAALRMIFDGWAMPVNPETERIVGTLDEIKKRYSDLSERLGWTINPPEVTVNRLGYQALGQNLPLAISFFRYNAATYPESANVYDSLGEALERSGAFEDALQSYRKAADLGVKNDDPNAGFFKANADRVRVKLLEIEWEKTPRR
jgi:tetratricopeptide (TPR) repeat protein